MTTKPKRLPPYRYFFVSYAWLCPITHKQRRNVTITSGQNQRLALEGFCAAHRHLISAHIVGEAA
jgi:hypothetical protein